MADAGRREAARRRRKALATRAQAAVDAVEKLVRRLDGGDDGDDAGEDGDGDGNGGKEEEEEDEEEAMDEDGSGGGGGEDAEEDEGEEEDDDDDDGDDEVVGRAKPLTSSPAAARWVPTVGDRVEAHYGRDPEELWFDGTLGIVGPAAPHGPLHFSSRACSADGAMLPSRAKGAPRFARGRALCLLPHQPVACCPTSLWPRPLDTWASCVAC